MPDITAQSLRLSGDDIQEIESECHRLFHESEHHVLLNPQHIAIRARLERHRVSLLHSEDMLGLYDQRRLQMLVHIV